MASCGLACTVPSCASSPVVGLGSAGIGANSGLGLGYGNLGYGCGSLGLGSGGLGYRGLSYRGLGGYGGGLGGYGGGLGGYGGGLGYGYGGLALGGSTSSAELGTLAGVDPQPINQIPASEVVIQPPASIVTIPGPILSASCEPVSVGGITPCAVGGSGIGGAGSGLLGSGLYGGLGYGSLGSGSLGYGGLGYGSGLRSGGLSGRRSLLGRCGSVCV